MTVVQSDCGQCPQCLDMKKFGGPGKKKQAQKMHWNHAGDKQTSTTINQEVVIIC